MPVSTVHRRATAPSLRQSAWASGREWHISGASFIRRRAPRLSRHVRLSPDGSRLAHREGDNALSATLRNRPRPAARSSAAEFAPRCRLQPRRTAVRSAGRELRFGVGRGAAAEHGPFRSPGRADLVASAATASALACARPRMRKPGTSDEACAPLASRSARRQPPSAPYHPAGRIFLFAYPWRGSVRRPATRRWSRARWRLGRRHRGVKRFERAAAGRPSDGGLRACLQTNARSTPPARNWRWWRATVKTVTLYDLANGKRLGRYRPSPRPSWVCASARHSEPPRHREKSAAVGWLDSTGDTAVHSFCRTPERRATRFSCGRRHSWPWRPAR